MMLVCVSATDSQFYASLPLVSLRRWHKKPPITVSPSVLSKASEPLLQESKTSMQTGELCDIEVDRIQPRYRIPESFSALFRIVSLTAAKTSRMFDVSVACVK